MQEPAQRDAEFAVHGADDIGGKQDAMRQQHAKCDACQSEPSVGCQNLSECDVRESADHVHPGHPTYLSQTSKHFVADDIWHGSDDVEHG